MHFWDPRHTLVLRHPRHSFRQFLERRKQTIPQSTWGARTFGADDELSEFVRVFTETVKNCTWKPHPEFSVFTQYDQDFYLKQKKAFLHKYKCFYAVSKTIGPQRILELGTHAGSGADAYISGSPESEYIGFDQFEDGVLKGITHKVTGKLWRPREVAEMLFAARGFKNCRLIKADLRSMEKLPFLSDFVVVDAAHDFDNQYADLRLALTAKPSFIFVDDADDAAEVRPAIERFLTHDVKDQVVYCYGVSYTGGGLVIKLKD